MGGLRRGEEPGEEKGESVGEDMSASEGWEDENVAYLGGLFRRKERGSDASKRERDVLSAFSSFIFPFGFSSIFDYRANK